MRPASRSPARPRAAPASSAALRRVAAPASSPALRRVAALAGLPAALPGVLGVTRVARVTGLDRTGVEVACAIRPLGHVVQVTNGKGETFAAAALGALLEAAELWAAERVDPVELLFGSRAELAAHHGSDAVWDPASLGSGGEVIAPRLLGPATRLAWCEARELSTGRRVFLPAQATRCPPAGAPLLGPALIRWSSNGMGAHPSRDRALLHALLEAVERDALSAALPQGFTAETLAARLLTPASLRRVAPRCSARAEVISAAGFEVHLLDLSGAVGLPVAGALLVDREQGPVPLTAGYACGLTRDGALLAALLEAAQSRLTDIHGAREDVVAPRSRDVARLRGFLDRTTASRSAAVMPDHRGPLSPAKAVRLVLGRLTRAGHDRAAAVSLAPPGSGLHVIKAVVPGLAISELL